MVKEGAVWELVRISRDSSREDLRILARQILTSSPIFLTDLKRVCAELRLVFYLTKSNLIARRRKSENLLDHILMYAGILMELR